MDTQVYTNEWTQKFILQCSICIIKLVLYHQLISFSFSKSFMYIMQSFAICQCLHFGHGIVPFTTFELLYDDLLTIKHICMTWDFYFCDLLLLLPNSLNAVCNTYGQRVCNWCRKLIFTLLSEHH